MARRLGGFALAGLTALAVAAVPAHAQFTKRVGRAVQDAAENKAISKVVEQEDRAIDAALSGHPSSKDDAAGKALYESLSGSGRTTADGIAFEPGTASLKAESAPTIKAIGAMLKDHHDIKLRIEAYGDDKAVGAARAEAIKQALVKHEDTDAARVQTEGYGAPADKRRVELVQL